MTSAPLPVAAGPPDDPVRRAAADPQVLRNLAAHAEARLLSLFGDRPAAVRAEVLKEVVQKTLERALGRSADYRPDRGTPAGWLHGFLNHVLSEQCREVRKQPAQPAADPAAWDALEARLAGDGFGELADLLDRLPADARRIIRLHHLEELSHGEIAARLGITQGASRTQLARAMNELRRLAAGKEGGR